MSIIITRKEVFDKLKVYSRVIGKAGPNINVGEKFKVRFEVWNRFPRSILSGEFNDADAYRYATFKNIKITVKGTPWAEVVGGDKTLDVFTGFSGNILPATRFGFVDVEFKALAAFPVEFLHEPYVTYRLKAEFDIQGFFSGILESTLWTQIKES
jgi:hypothetical protein